MQSRRTRRAQQYIKHRLAVSERDRRVGKQDAVRRQDRRRFRRERIGGGNRIVAAHRKHAAVRARLRLAAGQKRKAKNQHEQNQNPALHVLHLPLLFFVCAVCGVKVQMRRARIPGHGVKPTFACTLPRDGANKEQ